MLNGSISSRIYMALNTLSLSPVGLQIRQLEDMKDKGELLSCEIEAVGVIDCKYQNRKTNSWEKQVLISNVLIFNHIGQVGYEKNKL